MSFRNKIIVLIVLVLIIDQVSKIYVKTHFLLGESVRVFDWFQILFVENEGAAWGLKLPGTWGKLTLTIFRIIAVGAIAYLLRNIIENRKSKYLIVSVALVFSGAIGNIIDSIFYGVMFGDSSLELTRIFDPNPYGKLFYGKVVDMFSFPIINTSWPSWVPFLGGRSLVFFEYVFNIADASITVGGIGLFFTLKKDKKSPTKTKDSKTFDTTEK